MEEEHKEKENSSSETKSEKEKIPSKKIVFWILLAILIVATAAGSYFYGAKNVASPSPSSIASVEPTLEPDLASTTPTVKPKTATPKPTAIQTATSTPTPTPTSTPTSTPDNRADLYISNYSFNHEPVIHEPFTVSVTIYNQGSTASGDFVWEWWAATAAPTYAYRATVPSIVPHGGRVVTYTYTYNGWTGAGYESKAIVDVENSVNESNETNNTYTRNVPVIH